MGSEFGRDIARQAANVVGALFHILAGLVFATGVSPSEDITLIQPANYAFVVWAPIFLLGLAYAAYQALPANRENPLLRRVGWFIAGAFFFNGLLEILASPNRFVITQVLVVIMLFCLAVAYVRIARSERGVLGGADRWLVALPVGLFFGWITAATVVGAAQVLVFLGLLGGGIGEAFVGVFLLLVGGLVASAMVLVGKDGPPQGYLAYAAAVLWALVSIVANQYESSALTTGVAAISTAVVALVLISVLRGARPGRDASRIAGHGAT